MTDRLDALLVARGLARSRAVARDLITRGEVRVDGQVITKAATPTRVDAELQVAQVDPWVGRAAYKLLGALERFPLSVERKRCIDVGASTGGFTQVLLARGAARVEAIDVGHGQLAAVLRQDPRVVDHSGLNVRGIDPQVVGGPADLVVGDLSFISLTLVLDSLRALATPEADVVMLIKPQFEVGRERLARTGVVTSGHERARSIVQVLAAAQALGLYPHGLTPSPVSGGTGNREYLVWWRTDEAGRMETSDIDRFVDQVREGAL